MKKRKFNLLLQIATLCLCVAAIAFGVYSAKTASLNVSGTIGFEARNCNVSIATTITGAATQNFGDKATEGNPIKKDIVNINATSSTTNTETLNLGNLFFTEKDTVNDQAAPIKMKFAISNKSAFAIKASVTLPTSSEVTILADKDSIKIEAGSETTPTVGYITVTFKINTPDTGITKLDFSTNTFKFDFTKFEFKKSDIEVKYTDSALTTGAGLLSNYYIKYGSGKVGSTTYDINWFVIGTYGTDRQIKALTPATDFTKTLSTTAPTGKILKDNVTYAFMSDYILPCKDVPFNNNVFLDGSGEYNKSLEYPDIDANDYSISTVRSYLNGKTIYTEYNSKTVTLNGTTGTNYTPKTTGATANFFTQNTLKDNDIYTLIQPRTLENMYKKMSDSSTDLTLPTAVEGISGTDADAYWLLSYKEANALGSTGGSYDMKKMKGFIPTSSTISAGNWFLRSPYTTSSAHNRGIYDFNGALDKLMSVVKCGVRPAFLI